LRDPLILVGWSAGGIYIREFARKHPRMVAGMVLIDSSYENQDNLLPEELMKLTEESRKETVKQLTDFSKISHDEILITMGDNPFWIEYPELYVLVVHSVHCVHRECFCLQNRFRFVHCVHCVHSRCTKSAPKIGILCFAMGVYYRVSGLPFRKVENTGGTATI